MEDLEYAFLESYKSVERITLSQQQKQHMIDWLNKDKSLLGVIYCKFFDLRSLGYYHPIDEYLSNITIKHYYLRDVIVTFKIHGSLLHFMDNATSGDVTDHRYRHKTIDENNYSTWKEHKHTFFDFCVYDLESGVRLTNFNIDAPKFLTVYVRDYFFRKPKQNVTEYDVFVNMFGDEIERPKITTYLRYPYLAAKNPVTGSIRKHTISSPAPRMYKHLSLEKWSQTTFVSDLSSCMLIRIPTSGKIYTYRGLKRKLKSENPEFFKKQPAAIFSEYFH